MAISSSLLGGAGRALSVRLYRHYWYGHTISTVGRWMYRTAVGWLAWELTHSTGWLGVIAFADLAPTVFLAMVSGALADRFGFLRIIRSSLAMGAILTTLLGLLTVMHVITIEILLVLTFAFGSSESMGGPARMSAVNALVGRENLSSAIALGSAGFNASRIIGPATAGALIIWIGTGWVILLCALTFVAFLLLLRGVKLEEKRGAVKQGAGLAADIRSGVAYVFSHPGIRFVMVLLAATSFFIRPIIELMPGVSARIFDAGPQGLALLLASIGAGALGAGLWLARRGEMAGLTALLVLSTAITGVALMLAMQFRSIYVAALFLVLMGAFMLAGNVSAQTLVQNAVEPPYRARVMSIFIVFAYGLPAVGSVLMGAIAQRAGLQATIGAGAVFMLLFWLWSRPRQAAMSRLLEDTHAAQSPM